MKTAQVREHNGEFRLWQHTKSIKFKLKLFYYKLNILSQKSNELFFLNIQPIERTTWHSVQGNVLYTGKFNTVPTHPGHSLFYRFS